MAGRPRSEACDRAIADATLAEYAAHGLAGLRIEAVAARAGVGKATIYRRHPTKSQLVAAAAGAIVGEVVRVPDTGSLRADLLAMLGALRRALADPVLGEVARVLVAERDPVLVGVHADFVEQRRTATLAVLARAVERGEIPTPEDVEAAVDAVTAPLFWRHLGRRVRSDDRHVAAIVDDFLTRHGAPV